MFQECAANVCGCAAAIENIFKLCDFPDGIFRSLFINSDKVDKIIEHPFPDHYLFKPRDFNYGDEAIIVMTEKDAVKCVGFVDARLWCLRTKTELDNQFLNALLNRITAIDKNLKSSSS